MCDAPHTHAEARILFVSGVITAAAAQMNANAALFVRAPTRPKERNTLGARLRKCLLLVMSRRRQMLPPSEWDAWCTYMRAGAWWIPRFQPWQFPPPEHLHTLALPCHFVAWHVEAVAKTPGYFCHHFESFAEMSVRRSLNCGEAFLKSKSQETILWFLDGNLIWIFMQIRGFRKTWQIGFIKKYVSLPVILQDSSHV